MDAGASNGPLIAAVASIAVGILTVISSVAVALINRRKPAPDDSALVAELRAENARLTAELGEARATIERLVRGRR